MSFIFVLFSFYLNTNVTHCFRFRPLGFIRIENNISPFFFFSLFLVLIISLLFTPMNISQSQKTGRVGKSVPHLSLNIYNETLRVHFVQSGQFKQVHRFQWAPKFTPWLKRNWNTPGKYWPGKTFRFQQFTPRKYPLKIREKWIS